MASQTWTINTPQPAAIYPAGMQPALLVTNTSTAAVWVNNVPDNNGWQLPPACSLTWEAGKALYAYVLPGTSVQLVTLTNAGGLTSPPIIGRDSLTGALIRTAAAGPRVEVDSNYVNQVRFYTDAADEIDPGQISGYVDSADGALVLEFRSGARGVLLPAILNLRTNADGSTHALILADSTSISGPLTVVGPITAPNTPDRTRGTVTSGATNASGVITVTHGLGVVPANIQVTVNGANSIGDMTLRRSAKDATTFSLIYFYNGANAGVNVVSFDWIVEA